ncbi:MAG: chromosomal replication initiator protein DnaA [bacterium]|nr:chromosomal replication initiator protein DnaA [bacterium]
MTNEDLWQTVLGEMELTLSRANFVTWFKNTSISAHESGAVIVSVPNGFTQEWLENKYNKFILKSLRKTSPDVKEVKYVIGSYSPPPRREHLDVSPETQMDKESFAYDDQLSVGELEQPVLVNKANLNTRYTFSSFIVGSSNELANAASLAVAGSPGTVYNPLLIYGGVGLGKTHLMQAVGNEILAKRPGAQVKYIAAERFTTELINSLQDKRIEEFKQRYRACDVLIIDDIQFLSGKEKTQEEFFHTFNHLFANNKQIILSSDRPPKAIGGIEERLRSRFEGGMVADVGIPELEMRVAILKKKSEERNIALPDDVLMYISTKIQKNIRELEGALNKIAAYVQHTKTVPSLKIAEKILSSLINQPKRMILVRDIMKAVSDFYDIGLDEIVNQCRRKEVVRPRQITMYLLREELQSSYPAIGAKLGNRDHTTVMYGCEKITKELENNLTLQEEVRLIRERLYANMG